MKCFICKEDEKGNLCKKHANELYDMLINKKNLINNPDWRYHCQICGEHEGLIMVEYLTYGYFCNKDIVEEWEKYQ